MFIDICFILLYEGKKERSGEDGDRILGMLRKRGWADESRRNEGHSISHLTDISTSDNIASKVELGLEGKGEAS